MHLVPRLTTVTVFWGVADWGTAGGAGGGGGGGAGAFGGVAARCGCRGIAADGGAFGGGGGAFGGGVADRGLAFGIGLKVAPTFWALALGVGLVVAPTAWEPLPLDGWGTATSAGTPAWATLANSSWVGSAGGWRAGGL